MHILRHVKQYFEQNENWYNVQDKDKVHQQILPQP